MVLATSERGISPVSGNVARAAAAYKVRTDRKIFIFLMKEHEKLE